MSIMETDTIRETGFVTEEGDHDKEAHIVTPASAVTEAAFTGIPCRALCGKMWVPNRAPEQFGVCKRCIEVFEMSGNPWVGRR